MESFAVSCRTLCKNLTWRSVMVMGIVGSVVLVLQSFIFFHGSVLLTPYPAVKLPVIATSSYGGENSVPSSIRLGEFSLLSDSIALGLGVSKNIDSSKIMGEIDGSNGARENNRDPDENFALEKGRDPGNESALNSDRNPDKHFVLKKDRNLDSESASKEEGDPADDFGLEMDKDSDDDFGLMEDRYQDDELSQEKDKDAVDDFGMNKASDADNGFSQEKDKDPDDDLAAKKDRGLDDSFSVQNVIDSGDDSMLEVVTYRGNGKNPGDVFEPDNVGKTGAVLAVYTNRTVLKKLDANSSFLAKPVSSNVSFTSNQVGNVLPKGENMGPLPSNIVSSNDNSNHIMRKKQRMSPLNTSEMNRLLLRRRVSSHPMKPQWSSVRDRELLSAKKQIENAPILKNGHELYAPAFRNVSIFKRSYELMESILKVYVYKEGEKPIFHKPLLKGIYASEGWFIKLMEGNKHYVVKDPRKAHLFYLPFSSRLLQFALYVPRSHDHKNLIAYLKNYVDKIAAKYPFWNRTGGADHFLVACHDWAPAETRHNMERSIRALCNSDLSKGFKLGRDVSLPETYVRSGQNPLRDLGGEPPSKRPTLAFYAGNLHGGLRPILLKYWENKVPDMKIMGPMRPGVESKMTYIRHMKTSKYCICPRGHGVNSPRVVEAIFYECVPVIISDNYVPPFFEVLDWEAFSVFVAEKDIPILKDILMSIPEERYLTLQMGVKKVQQHFLWHSKPMKYDIFHMILHSVWLNRLHQIRI